MRPTPRLRLPYALAALLAALSAPSLAIGDDVDWDRTGPYVGAGAVGGQFLTASDAYANQFVALGLETFDSVGNPDRNDDLEHDISPGFDLYAGYRIHRFLAAELEFEMLPGVEFDVNEGTLVEADTFAFTGALRAILPLGRFEPYVLGGVGVMEAKLDDSQDLGVIFKDGADLLARVGGGFDFHIARCVALRFSAEWMIPRGDLHELDYVSIGGGLQYRF